MKVLNVYSWKPASGSNFGDVIGPMIAEQMVALAGEPAKIRTVASGPAKLHCVGSTLQKVSGGDFVWGAGVNGKSWLQPATSKLKLSIMGVRGPISRAALHSVGQACPETYGDPGLLFPVLFHNEIMAAAHRLRDYYDRVRGGLPKTVFISNLNDERFYFPEANLIPPDWEILNTMSSPVTVAAQIMLCDRVVSSSLHGIVFADALGKAACFFSSRFEPRLKYDDYFLGTGRDPVHPYERIDDDLVPNVATCTHDMGPMLRAFPREAVIEQKAPRKTPQPKPAKSVEQGVSAEKAKPAKPAAKPAVEAAGPTSLRAKLKRRARAWRSRS